MPESFKERLAEEIRYQKAEIREMELEMERCDQFDTYKYPLRERLQSFRHALKINEEMLANMFPEESEEKPA